MPARNPVKTRHLRERVKPSGQTRPEEEQTNVLALAEHLLPLVQSRWTRANNAKPPLLARYFSEPYKLDWMLPSSDIPPHEWLWSLTRPQFQMMLYEMGLEFLVLPWNEVWRDRRAKTASLPSDDAERLLAKELGKLTRERLDAILPKIKKIFRDWYRARPRAIEPQEPITYGAKVAEEDDRIVRKQGTRYFPLALAADIAQVPRTTLVDWIKAKKSFAGRKLEIYNSPTAHKLFLSEESVQRLANRFVKWSGEEKKATGPAAGPVKIEKRITKTQAQNGYIGLAKAAKAIGTDYHTLWLWAIRGKGAPANKSLNVIKDTASKQFYIRTKDVADLKPLIPKSGLRRGRRPQWPEQL